MSTVLRLATELLIVLLPIALVIWGIVSLVRRAQGTPRTTLGAVSTDASQQPVHLPVAADRFLIYTLSFAGLMSVVFAVAGLAALVVAQPFPQAAALLSNQDTKVRVSYYLAALFVGTPIWLGFWRIAQSRIQRSPAERQAPERRLYLAGIFAVTSIVVLISTRSLVATLLGLPGGGGGNAALRDTIVSAALALTYAVAWLYYGRLGWRERSPQEPDAAYDVAVYLLAAVSLAMVTMGTVGCLQEILHDLQGAEQHTLVHASAWARWGNLASSVLIGGATWGAIWSYDVWRSGRRILRVIYLYLVVAVAGAVTVVTGSMLLYELVRRAIGYRDPVSMWGFLPDLLPPVLVLGAVWAFHWHVIRDQAAIVGEARLSGTILWPRRLGIVVLCLVGLMMASVAFVAILWLALDFALTAHAAVSGGNWWRDRLSGSLATGGIGCALWLPAWYLLQRAAEVRPENERAAPERRWLLGLITLAAALVAIGFSVALLYQIWRGILGATDANTLSDALRYLSAVAVATAIGAYYGAIFLRERLQTPARATVVRVTALLGPGGEESLRVLRTAGLQIEVGGYLPLTPTGTLSDLADLQSQIQAVSTDRALLLLVGQGGMVVPFDSRPPAPASLPANAPLAHGSSSSSPGS